jgi:CheY-like chemotaxis protein
MTRAGEVLFVDDETDWIDLLQMAFERAGMPNAVTGVNDGEEAIRYLRGETPYTNRASHPLPKLVLLDLRLPGMHGFEVLRWIRRQPALAALPVVVITGMQKPGELERAHELGANGFLIKPVLFPKVVEMAQKLREHWLRPEPQPNAREEVQHPG